MTTRYSHDFQPRPNRVAGAFLIAAIWLFGSPRRRAARG